MYRKKFRRDEGRYQIQEAISAVGRGKSRKTNMLCVGVIIIIIFAALYAPKNPLVPSLLFFVSALGHGWLLPIGAAVP
jgi:hypothetical protein